MEGEIIVLVPTAENKESVPTKTAYEKAKSEIVAYVGKRMFGKEEEEQIALCALFVLPLTEEDRKNIAELIKPDFIPFFIEVENTDQAADAGYCHAKEIWNG